MERFEVTAAIVLFRGREILVMKRASGFSAGGWFFPGGHLEPRERPAEACARELREETGITIDPAAPVLADVMTMETGEGTAHCLLYTAECAAGTECILNDEHVAARWVTPESYVERFLDPVMLRARGVPEAAVVLATEVARVLASAVALRRAGP